jgi:hypothetical protein
MSEATRIFDELVDTALMRLALHGPPRTGRPDAKPGYMVGSLSPEKRSALSALTSEDVNQRALRPEYVPTSADYR